MPGIIKVKIHEAKDLPVMDRASDLTDAFVEVRHGTTVHKTDVCRKSLNPTWNSEWLRFEADDEPLQDEPLQVKVFDYDIYSAHDTIGKVMIGLSSLLLKNGTNEMGGWFPIYDTLHGIRGYIQISVKIDFFVDANKFRQTSCGVRFFSTSAIPSGFMAVAIQGFVDVLVVNDDPEYQWIDKIRTPRASNDARMRLFSKLSGEVNRRLGLKVLDAGGNAVIGYFQCFDIEGDTGIVVRGIGTSVTIIKAEGIPSAIGSLSNSPEASSQSVNNILDAPFKSSFEMVKRLMLDVQRQKSISSRYNRTVSNSSDGNDIINEASLLLNTSGESPEIGFAQENALMNVSSTAQRVKSMGDFEFPFLTVTKVPPGFVVHVGGVISSKSVKLLDEINNPDGPETRESWWNEVRTEMRSHAKALGCHAVIGYVESTTICDDVMVLSAMGTAAIVRLPDLSSLHHFQDQFDDPDSEAKKTRKKSECENEVNEYAIRQGASEGIRGAKSFDCRVCHVPFNDTELPFTMSLSKCTICKYGKVPDVIFATIEPPPEMIITGTGCIIQARVYRTKKREKDEAQAESVSQILPFLEYELHRQLMNKLKVKGMNAVFGIKMQISVGENIVVGLMTGTAMFITALPAPPLFVVSGSKNDSSLNEKKLLEMQKRIIDETTKNRARMNLCETLDIFSTKTPPNTPVFNVGGSICSESIAGSDKVEDIQGQLDLVNGVRETYVITVDDNIEDEILSTLTEPSHIDGGHAFNTEAAPGIPNEKSSDSQFISMFHLKKLSEDDLKISIIFPKMCEDMIQALHFKLRNRKPYFLNKVSFNIKIPEDNELQVSLTAFASFLGGPTRQSFLSKSLKSDDDDCLFPMEVSNSSHQDSGKSTNSRNTNDSQKELKFINLAHTWPTNQFNNIKNLSFIHGYQHHDIYCDQVVISPLSELPNRPIDQYIGNLNLFFIRETTAVKEDGGLNMFMQTFLAEVHAIVRSQVAAMSGDGIMSFAINDVTLLDSSHKNQGQCLLNASGDVVKFTLENELLSQLATSNKLVHNSTAI